MGHTMDSEKEEIKKYLKASSIKAELEQDGEGPKLMTNIEAYHEGKFPDKLVEKFESPPSLRSESVINKIELEHKELLKGRPIPELLETVSLIGNLEDLHSPAMGKLYEEKRLSESDEKKNLDTRK
tara:strand:+ start:136 stop:513 length:378 start_codon:yes stop_codon:yes gene_type:complete